MTIIIDETTMNRMFLFFTCIGMLLTICFISVLYFRNEAEIRDAKRFEENN
jgi:hypothetical protein